MELVVAERVVGSLQGIFLADVDITGMEDDPDPWGNWSNDDTLFNFRVVMNARSPGETFTIEEKHGDWHYKLTFRIDVDGFSDPDPDPVSGEVSDSDGDGLSDEVESDLTNWLGGRANPTRKGIYLEVDNVRDRDSHNRALWQVGTAFIIKGVYVEMFVDVSLPRDHCISRADAILLDQDQFDLGIFPGFRHAILAQEIYNGRSGVSFGDSFLVSTPTVRRPWGEERAIAGTFIHELGHSLGLTQSDFPLIDKLALNASYRSAMTYFWQPLIVEYSDNAGGFGDNFDDWEHLNIDTPSVPGQAGFQYTGSDFTGLNTARPDDCN